MAYMNKHNLADYITTEHIKRTGRNISIDKLQKTLYYLFSTWGGDMRNLNARLIKGKDEMRLDEELFVGNFKAGEDGPTDEDVERMHIRGKYGNREDVSLKIESKELKDSIEKYIEAVMDASFGMNDRDLVEISKYDSSWINARKFECLMMKNEHIIEEYSRKC